MNNQSGPMRKVKALFVTESVVVTVIVINAIAIFLAAFPEIQAGSGSWLWGIDYACIVFYVIESLFKTRGFTAFRPYWKQGWNKMDFIIVVCSLPILIGPFVPANFDEFALVLLLRVSRLLRFFRLLQIVPEAGKILSGVVRALKASVGIVLVLFLVNIVLSLCAMQFFGHIPETQAFFGDPIRSMYSMFKVFTVEGWYDIPEQMAAMGVGKGLVVAMKLYFVLAVLVGGIIGLSIANAIFVDEMAFDNTDEVEEQVRELRRELREFREEFQKERLS